MIKRRVLTVLLPFMLACCSPVSRSPEATVPLSEIVAKYDRKLIRRPGDTPEDGKVYIVLNGQKRWVLHSQWLQAHGYNWPNDVQTVPASELNAIPTGSPILEMR